MLPRSLANGSLDYKKEFRLTPRASRQMRGFIAHAQLTDERLVGVTLRALSSASLGQ